VPFSALLSTLIRRRFQVKSAALLIPIDPCIFLWRVLRYPIPKWLLILDYYGEWFFTACLVFSFSSSVLKLSTVNQLTAAIWKHKKNAGTIPQLELPTERVLPRLANICRLPKDLGSTVQLINANIGNISDTLHGQVPPIMHNKSTC